MLRLFAIVAVCFAAGCSQLNTKPEPSLGWFANELCTHSQAHRDLILLAVSEESEPHVWHLECNAAR